jgi:hypothetical protein
VLVVHNKHFFCDLLNHTPVYFPFYGFLPWFSTLEGLVRFMPEPERTGKPPTVLITGFRVFGVAQKISLLGETS